MQELLNFEYIFLKIQKIQNYNLKGNRGMILVKLESTKMISWFFRPKVWDIEFSTISIIVNLVFV
jgi:hypothetical protein